MLVLTQTQQLFSNGNMQRLIVTDPHPVLRSRSLEVPREKICSAELRKIIRDLKDTLKNSEDGIGIAAPQIGIGRRIFIVSEEAKFIGLEEPRVKEKDWASLVYINPAIIKRSKTMGDGVEGCLSVPGKFGIVSRHQKIVIKAYDENGKSITHGAAKFFARVLQHESDHLDGVLFIDKVRRFVDVTTGDGNNGKL